MVKPRDLIDSRRTLENIHLGDELLLFLGMNILGSEGWHFLSDPISGHAVTAERELEVPNRAKKAKKVKKAKEALAI